MECFSLYQMRQETKGGKSMTYIESATIQDIIDELQKAKNKKAPVVLRGYDGEWTNDIDLTMNDHGEMEIE
jgi:hypothetical protein